MPKTKKDSSSSDSSDSGPDDAKPAPAKKSKNGNDKGASGTAAGDNPNGPWTLEKLRQVRINEFKGRRMVDIREFYEKGGEILPGKKGIALQASQWKRLLELAPEITKALGE